MSGSRERALHCGRKWPTAIDLFCGSGAVTAALKRSHFRVLAALDVDSVACETYRLNHPKVRLYEEDIRQLAPERLKKEAVVRNGLDLLVVCAPCQPFSSQNKNRKQDGRSSLLLDAARFVPVLKPRVILVENVPGLASERNSELVQEFVRICGGSYQFGSATIVDAADYGVPQRRKRMILMGASNGSPPEIPKPHLDRVTVRQAISHLPSLEAGETDEDDHLHAARAHGEIALKRLRAISKDGGSRFDLPEELELDCHKGTRAYPDVFGRLSWDDVAPTLTTGCTDVTKGRFVHPVDDRGITPREAALLQTFPPDYRFSGGIMLASRQIGNAVPCQLVRSFAPSIRECLKRV